MRVVHERLLIISGPVGVGKTSIATRISSLLQEDNVPHSFVDLDWLTYTYPRTSADPFNNNIALETLETLWAQARKQGSKNLIISRVIEAKGEADRIAQAVGISEMQLCRLKADDGTLLRRVRTRGVGTNLLWQEARSIELSAALERANFEDFSVETEDRSKIQIAKEICLEVNWIR